MLRVDVIAAARETLGTRWVHQGRPVAPPAGSTDCVGVVLYCMRKLGVSDFEPPTYQRSAKWHEFLHYFQDHLQQIDIRDAVPGDVLCFRQEVYPCHCGILTNRAADDLPLRFVHGYALRRKVVEEAYTDEWKTLTRAAFRFPGLED